MATKYRDLIKMIENDGWTLKRTTGSHMQYRHEQKAGTVTIAAGGKMNKVVPPGTLNSVLKQAGLK
ncbi:MAG: type II toxin-antitoxin system HicA family toxin [Planctomycetota bacterium]